MTIEAELFETLGFGVRDFEAITFAEVMMFYAESLDRRSQAVQWQLRASSMTGMTESDRSKTWELARGISLSFSEYAGFYDGLTDEQRVRLIGSSLNCRGSEKFRAAHPEQIEWLESQGVSEAEAIRRFSEWIEKAKKPGRRERRVRVVSRRIIRKGASDGDSAGIGNSFDGGHSPDLGRAQESGRSN